MRRRGIEHINSDTSAQSDNIEVKHATSIASDSSHNRKKKKKRSRCSSTSEDGGYSHKKDAFDVNNDEIITPQVVLAEQEKATTFVVSTNECDASAEENLNNSTDNISEVRDGSDEDILDFEDDIIFSDKHDIVSENKCSAQDLDPISFQQPTLQPYDYSAQSNWKYSDKNKPDNRSYDTMTIGKTKKKVMDYKAYRTIQRERYQNSKNNPVHWKQLPTELQELIFSYIPHFKNAFNICLACKRFRLLFLHSRLELELSSKVVGLLDDNSLRAVVMMCTRARRLSLSGQKWMWFFFSKTNFLMQHLAQNIPNLPSVNGLYCSISDLTQNVATSVSSNIPRSLPIPLDAITSIRSIDDINRIKDEGLQRLQHVTSTVLPHAGSYSLSPSSIPYFSCDTTDCYNSCSVHNTFSNIGSYLIPSAVSNTFDQVQNISRSLPNIREIDIDQVQYAILQNFHRLSSIQKDVTATINNTIGSKARKSLDLATGEELSDSAVHDIALNLPYLRSLDLSMCNVTDIGIQHIAENLPQLQELFLQECSKISDTGVAHITNNLSRLTKLDLSKCKSITSKGLRLLVANLSDVSCLTIADMSEAVTDKVLLAIGTKMPQLLQLDISNSDEISDSGIAQMLEPNKLANLQEINLSHCNISDKSISSFTNHCLALQKMDLASCFNITDHGVTLICSKLKLLEWLRVEYCYNITDQSLHIVQQTNNILYFNVAGCSGVTESEAYRIAKLRNTLTIDTEIV